jgi:hypothetical protein
MYTDPSGYQSIDYFAELSSNDYGYGGGGVDHGWGYSPMQTTGSTFGRWSLFGPGGYNPYSGLSTSYHHSNGTYYNGHGQQVTYEEVHNNYILPNASGTFNVSEGWTFSVLNAFGRKNIIASIGNRGDIIIGKDGGIRFSNLTATWINASGGGGFFSPGDVYYGSPESQSITFFGSIAGIYNKVNQVLSDGLVKKIAPIVHRHWGVPTMPVLKYSKYVPYIGTPADLLSLGGASLNIYNYGWSTEHALDLSFAIIGFIPGYGDAASLLYMGSKEAYNLSNQIWDVTRVGINRLEQNSYWGY